MLKNRPFRSAARFYDRFKPPYPRDFFDAVVEEYNLDGKRTCLDLACGTGQLCLNLTDHFQTIIGIDPEEEMLRQAKEKSDNDDSNNILWVQGSSDDLCVRERCLHLVTIGRGFHLMDRGEVLEKLFIALDSSGGVVIVNDLPLWSVKEPFAQTTNEVIKKYLGEDRRFGKKAYKSSGISHETFVQNSPFPRHQKVTFNDCRTWTVDSILGYCYSTSYASPEILGDSMDDFERDIRQELLNLDPKGTFIENAEVEAYFLFKSP